MSTTSTQLLEALLAESAGEELLTRVGALLRTYDPAGAHDLGAWFHKTFPAVFGSRTPTGQKDLKTDAEWFHRFLAVANAPWSGKGTEDFISSQRKEFESRWNRIKDRVPELVRFFSNEDKAEGKAVPAELKLGGVTYINGIGFDEKKLKKWATSLNELWGSVKGWRHKAITTSGGLTVKLARPQEFRGTASGKYRSADDVLYVRATPNILKREGGTYGAPDYIMVHELGHRYEWKVKGLPVDFDKPAWWTTKYSRSEGEAFAELFALGHFGPGIQRVSTAVDNLPDRLERFEKVMAGGVQESEIGHLHLLPASRKVAKARVKRGDRGEVIARGADKLTGYRSTTRHKTVGGGF